MGKGCKSVLFSMILIIFFVIFPVTANSANGTSSKSIERPTISKESMLSLQQHKKIGPDNGEPDNKLQNRNVNQTENKIYEISVSAVGDVTIGTDETFGYSGSFVQEVDRHKGDLSYFVKDLTPIFSEDDLTIANLETTLTLSTQKATKKFRFKGDPSYVQILQLANIETVNIANNHIHDYLNKGFQDTINTLKKANVGYCGYKSSDIKTINGIKIGLLGFEGWDYSGKQEIGEAITKVRSQTDLVIVSFHWGVERANYPTEIQKNLAHYAIDQGADLILGHHPHVVQGIENYKGKYIVYSLGNFLFGGNRNPSDKDTFVFQQTFRFTDQKELLADTEMNVIPFSISSTKSRNNYQPTKLEGKEKVRVLERIRKYSKGFDVSF